MKNLDNVCFICGSERFVVAKNNYKKCLMCGHQIICTEEKQSFIINDILDPNAVKTDFLFRLKKSITLNSAKQKNLLIDIGSGSGQFLFFMKGFFDKVVGIEITKECIEFSKNILDLTILENVNELKENFSVATFWHSLEHIPSEEIKNILNRLNTFANNYSRIIVSVPNIKSLQYVLFSTGYAFYDYPNHIHQFSYNSLTKLFKNYGFIKEKDYFSFYYIFFGYIQGMLNKVNKIHNYFYYKKKRGIKFALTKFQALFLNLYNLLLILICLIPAILMTFLEFFTKKKRSVITICLKKKV